MKSQEPTYSFKGSFSFLLIFFLCLGIFLHFEDDLNLAGFFSTNDVHPLQEIGFILLVYVFSISWFGFVRRELIRVERKVFVRSFVAGGFLVVFTTLYFFLLTKFEILKNASDTTGAVLTFLVPAMIFIVAIFICFSGVKQRGILHSFISLFIFSTGASLFYFALWAFFSTEKEFAGELPIHLHNSILVFSFTIRLLFVPYLVLGILLEKVNYKKIKSQEGGGL